MQAAVRSRAAIDPEAEGSTDSAHSGRADVVENDCIAKVALMPAGQFSEPETSGGRSWSDDAPIARPNDGVGLTAG
jgi:hypothetical protein